MRLDELEEMMNEQPEDAEAAIAELVSSSDVEELSHIATSGRVEALQLRAIEGLGDVGGLEATATLIEMLEAANTPFLVGGTEQELEHERRQHQLIQSLGRARGVPPPDGRTEREIAEFIEECRTR